MDLDESFEEDWSPDRTLLPSIVTTIGPLSASSPKRSMRLSLEVGYLSSADSISRTMMSSFEDFPARSLGDLHLVAPLGGGRFGAVTAMRCQVTGELLAVKLPKTARDAPLLAHEVRAAQALAALPAPLHAEDRRECIIDYVGVVKADPASGRAGPGLIMPVLAGSLAAAASNHARVAASRLSVTTDFADFADASTAAGSRSHESAKAPAPPTVGLPIVVVQHVASCLCRALRACAAAGITHRDLRPANVLVAADGSRVVLSDFGIASLGPDDTSEAAAMTGSVLYASPERLRGMPHGPAADVWSLGICVAELLLGQHPYVAAGFLPAAAVHDAFGDAKFLALFEVFKLASASPAASPASVLSRSRMDDTLPAPDSLATSWMVELGEEVNFPHVARPATVNPGGAYFTLNVCDDDAHIDRVLQRHLIERLAASHGADAAGFVQACLWEDPGARATPAALLDAPFVRRALAKFPDDVRRCLRAR